MGSLLSSFINSFKGSRPARPLFSVLHTTARPDQWRKVYDDWIGKAVNPDDVEYVLCVDERWGFGKKDLAWLDGMSGWLQSRGALNKCVWNDKRRCYVDGVNTAAAASTGSILIVNADDQFACDKWDARLSGGATRIVPNGEMVWRVSTGTPGEHERGIMVMPILSRARYERLGYVFYPEYESMYADNDFFEHAQRDGVVIDARGLLFPHKHPLQSLWQVKWDAAYDAQNRPEAYSLGKKVLDRRRACNFGTPEPEQLPAPCRDPRSIFVCLPGDTFSRHWVAAWTDLMAHLLNVRGFRMIRPSFNYTSCAAITRGMMARDILALPELPELVLWIDDDNILTPAGFDQLLADLDGLAVADLMAAWTWIQDDGGLLTHTSAGKFTGDRNQIVFIPAAEMEKARGVIEIEWTGFPAVLMRGSTIQKAGPIPFAPLPAPASEWGVTGEDVAFCTNAKERGGCRLFVDPKVFVPHLKLRAIAPRAAVDVPPNQVMPDREGSDVAPVARSQYAGATMP